MTEKTEPTISYYSLDGYACRVLENQYGSRTADLYRGGMGLIEISPTDVIWDGREISEKNYKELVLEEIALHKKKEGAEGL